MPMDRNGKAILNKHFSKQNSAYLAGKLQKIPESQTLSQAKLNLME